ncbi:MAG: cupredoxin domain-containing protein [Minisyncoccia bacterium]
MKKNILTALTFLVIIVLVFFLFSKNNEKTNEIKNYSIVLNKDGFSPNELTINQGDTVVFTTSLNKDFWPASDLHPTHGVYSDFDPKKPIKSSESWSFKFDKAGKWGFHDHLNDLSIGFIVVSGESKNSGSCEDDSEKLKCWQKELNSTLENKGLPETFDLLSELYSSEPLFASECHSFAHEIGKFAYKQFSKGRDFELNSKTSYCGYGFYHGFMESMLQSTGDIKEAKYFCRYVGEKLAKDTTDGEGACYHGIGHGSVDGSEERFWGNPEKMIESGMSLCLKVSEGDTSKYGKLYRCVTGAYNAIEILSHDPKYKLSKFEKDPFSFCTTQIDEYKEGCYTNMLPAILMLTQNDLFRSQKYIENIKEKDFEIRKPVTSGLWVEFIRLNLNKPDQNIIEGIKMCQLIADPMRLSCFYGLAEGYMKYGDPKDAYLKGLSFCSNSLLKVDEEDVCFNSILTRLRIWYSESKSKEICLDTPKEYQKYCFIL